MGWKTRQQRYTEEIDGSLINDGLIGSIILDESWKCVFFHD